MKKLENKVAIVTGGARDLGRAVSVKMAEAGAKVVINYFDNEQDAIDTQAIIAQMGGESIIVQGDMTKAADVKRIVEEAVKAFGNEIQMVVFSSLNQEFPLNYYLQTRLAKILTKVASGRPLFFFRCY